MNRAARRQELIAGRSRLRLARKRGRPPVRPVIAEKLKAIEVMPLADQEDAAFCAGLKAAHCAEFNQPFLLGMGAMLIAKRSLTGERLACMSIQPVPTTGKPGCLIEDLFAVDSRWGKLAIRALLERVDALNQAKYCTVAVGNERMLALLTESYGMRVEAYLLQKGHNG